MFENKTPETILSDMLSGISQSYDTREGSVIYTALAPFAQELSALYGALDDILSNTFVDTADLAHLILRAKERGLTYIDATKAIVDVTLTFDTGADDIAVGDRFFTADGVVYIWQGAKDDTDSIYLMECAEAADSVRRAAEECCGNPELPLIVTLLHAKEFVRSRMLCEEEDSVTRCARSLSDYFCSMLRKRPFKIFCR